MFFRFWDDNPFSLIPLFRRSPDPTIQWVRLDQVEALYKGRESGTKYLDLADVERHLARTDVAPPLYDRIAQTNAKMARRLGVDRIEKTLARFSDDAQRAYAEVLLDESLD